MLTSQSPKATRTRQSRKSIAHVPGVDKENATLDSAALSTIASQLKEKPKKSRSKSIGPGGLDALKEGNGNRGEPAVGPIIKSILKTSSYFSPPKAIPQWNTGRTSPSKSPSSRNVSSPARSPTRQGFTKRADGQENERENSLQSPRRSSSPAKSPTRSNMQSEEEKHEASRERQRQERLVQREARRKSLASRRVSFAPEATLHTWNVIEIPEDSTTSTGSANSTRRGSELAGRQAPQSPQPSSDASEPPSTPPEQLEAVQVTASPAHQRDLHQKKRRRSSAIPPTVFTDTNEFSSSPASIVSEDTEPQHFETIDGSVDSSDSDEGDLEEDETVTQVDGEDSTTQSAGLNSTNSSGRLEASLAQAARQAGTQGIDFDENGDLTMEMADDEVTDAFKPWMASTRTSQVSQDQENVNPFLNDRRGDALESELAGGDETMDMTSAVGGILNGSKPSPKRGKRKSVAASRRRSSVTPGSLRRDDSGSDGDDTMELTMPLGMIRGPDTTSSSREDEDMPMEMTIVMGGLIRGGDKTANLTQNASRAEAEDSTISGEDMDMTFAAGNILPPITETTEPISEASMNFTAAVGSILPQQLSTGSKEEAKVLMEEEADVGQFPASPFGQRNTNRNLGAGLTDERPLPALANRAASSPGFASPRYPKLSTPTSAKSKGGTPKSSSKGFTPKSAEKTNTPSKIGGTPSKQITPQPPRPTTPGKTPPSKNVTVRSASPKRLFQAEIKKAQASTSAQKTPESRFQNPLFKRDAVTGTSTPSIVLQPGRRSLAGFSPASAGQGSPKSTELLNRRRSIGEDAQAFVPQRNVGGAVRFEDPRILEQEVDEARKEDVRRESGRVVLEQDSDAADKTGNQDLTANLKDMIGSLTPQKKKTKLNGRKSLHVGAAKGLLGKRPAELDDPSDEEDSTKRLRGREGSPVKKIKLPAPPAKNQTTGRMTRSLRRSLDEIDANAQASTPSVGHNEAKVSTRPKDQTRFRDVEPQVMEHIDSFEDKLEKPVVAPEPPEEEDEPIQLQDFLNLTNVRFIELTTTKRRHTVVPGGHGDQTEKVSSGEDGQDKESKSDFESCVVAGTCTVPMLELYQHSCRELKKYISEGRSIVKEIEADTFAENPPLFKEYVSASPGTKVMMDNQFKNVKTNARFLSKAMWYEWRMKLLDGLKEGLLKIGDDMEQDHECLQQQEQLLQPILPALIEQHDQLEEKANAAQAQADELADCNQEELQSAREEFDEVEQELEEKRKLVEELQNELREKEDRLETVLTRKELYSEEIVQAEKTLEDCRGWTPTDLAALQARVDALESSHGWLISAVNGQSVTMTFRRDLELFFTPSAFAVGGTTSSTTPSRTHRQQASIGLGYIGDTPVSSLHHASSSDIHRHRPTPLSTPKRFLLQILRVNLQCLHQSTTRSPDLLSHISSSWTLASRLDTEICHLGIGYPTSVSILADDHLHVKCTVLLEAMATKLIVGFDVRVASRGDDSSSGLDALEVTATPTVSVIYGEALKEGKMGEFVTGRIREWQQSDEGGDGRGGRGGVWVNAIRELEDRCRARGKKP